MADHLQESLGKMLDQYDQRRNAELARVQKLREDEALFLARFAEIRRTIVRPVFEAAGATLSERGHEFSISEADFSSDSERKIVEAGISIRIMPSGMMARAQDDEHARSLSITTRHYNKTVWINAGAGNAGGTAGAKGAYPLDRIDRQFVEEELLKFVASIVGA
jgi:hypothetical protein